MTDLPELPELPERPVDPDWLALREPADVRSRDAVADAIMPPLLGRLRDSGDTRDRGLRVVDLGAGTGANLRWLAPRLAVLGGPAALQAQRWILVDHDPRLRAWGPAASTTVRADVAHLGRLLSDVDGPDRDDTVCDDTVCDGTDLVTAAALLDLLDGSQLSDVVDAVLTRRTPALFSLNVTGVVVLSPADPLDGALAAAFDAHQRREGRLGPDAGAEVAERFRRGGWDVVQAQTPWRLLSQEAALLDAWLVGRVEAAVEWQPSLTSQAAAWLDRRRAQRRAGTLSAVVGHVDVLALPEARHDPSRPA